MKEYLQNKKSKKNLQNIYFRTRNQRKIFKTSTSEDVPKSCSFWEYLLSFTEFFYTSLPPKNLSFPKIIFLYPDLIQTIVPSWPPPKNFFLPSWPPQKKFSLPSWELHHKRFKFLSYSYMVHFGSLIIIFNTKINFMVNMIKLVKNIHIFFVENMHE